MRLTRDGLTVFRPAPAPAPVVAPVSEPADDGSVEADDGPAGPVRGPGGRFVPRDGE